MTKLLTFLARLVTRHRAGIIWGTLILFVLVLLPIRRIHFSTDVLELIPKELGSLQTFRELDRHFVQGSDLAVLIEMPSGDKEALAAFQQVFVEELRAMPEIRGVTPAIGSTIDPTAWRWLWERFWLVLESHEMDALIGKLKPDQIRESVHRARLRIEAAPTALAAQQVIHDPLGLSEVFISHLQTVFVPDGIRGAPQPEAGAYQMLSLVTRINMNDSRACMRLMNKVREVEQRARGEWSKQGREHTPLQIGYTGRVTFTAEIATKMRSNMFGNGCLSLAMVLFLFWLGFRNHYPLLAIAVTLIMAVLANTVLCGLLFGGFNMISGSFAAILVGLGVDYGILIYNRYSLAMNSEGMTREDAILHTAKCTVPGILLGALTTAAAFLGITWTSSPGFRQFGLVVSMGIVLCMVLMTVFYFAMIAGRRPRPIGFDLFGHLLQLIGNAVMKHRRAVLIGTAVMFFAAWVVVLGGDRPGVRFDVDPHSLRFGHSPAFDTLEKILARLHRTSNPCVLLIGGKDWTEVAETTEQLHDRLEQAKTAGIVEAFESPSTMLPAVSRQKQNAQRLAALDWTATRDAFHTALTTEGFRVEEFQPTLAWLAAAQTNSVAPDSILLTPSHWLEHGGESSLLVGRYVYAGTGVVETATYVYPTEPLRSIQAIRNLSTKLGVDGQKVRLTNWDALILEMQPIFRRDFLRISVVVLVAVMGIVWLGYRKLKPLVFISIPLGGALLCMLACMKIFGIKFNLANFFAIPIVIGAGVDYAIHMLNGVEEEHGDRIAAIRVTGKAVVVNALTTMIGFGSLMLTDHTGLATLGLLTTLGISFCMVLSLVTLPLCVGKKISA